jgi:hypothetical protein
MLNWYSFPWLQLRDAETMKLHRSLPMRLNFYPLSRFFFVIFAYLWQMRLKLHDLWLPLSWR